ncbi:MAG: outer membrane protein assembly factor BamE [Lactobacillales bacterium]|jgi:outer membrane protein assembly factor BamE (lipoprotein component of BamABCDE complex)|nr:outer membrane protein assembly factor BamE [Lactobacillales bacterium]
MKRILLISMLALSPIFLFSCGHAIDDNRKEENITVAKAQKEIKKGMTSAEVIEAMGSPNIITTDDQGRETWVYDKISTESMNSSSQSYLWLVLLGMGGKNSASSTNQRTLTIVVKFDNANKVRDVAYRTSSF